jgi:hypothetical protein
MQNTTSNQPTIFQDPLSEIKPFSLQHITAMKLAQLRLLNEAAIQADARGHHHIAADARAEMLTTRYEAMHPQSVIDAIQKFFVLKKAVA